MAVEGVWELVRAQHGAVAAWQFDNGGRRSPAIRPLIESGALLRTPLRGVYVAAGSVATWQRSVLVHLLAAGPEAAASIWTSAALLGVPGFKRGRIAISRPWKASRKTAPSWLHESTYLPPHQITVVEDIRCVRLDRTLFDLFSHVGWDRASAATKSSLSRGRTSYGRLEQMFFETARRGRKGSAAMRLFLDNYDAKVVTESELEDMVEAVLAAGGITGFVRQVNLGSDEAFIGRRDWKHERAPVVIEAQSAEFHTDWAVQVEDCCKALASSTIGVRTIGVTYAILVKKPDLFIAAVRRELATFLPEYRLKGGEFA